MYGNFMPKKMIILIVYLIIIIVSTLLVFIFDISYTIGIINFLGMQLILPNWIIFQISYTIGIIIFQA